MEVITRAKTYFSGQFPDWAGATDVTDAIVQRELWQRMHATVSSEPNLAELCLRCFISYQVDQVCRDLGTKFGTRNGFASPDLLPFVLDDDGKPWKNSQYRSLSCTVLQSFDPAKASLGTWVTLQVKQHPELRRFLLEQGVYLVSDWAILNDTTPKQLQRIWAELYQLTDADIQVASELLKSFHAIYREDRLRQRLTGAKQVCQQPTPEQLNRIASDLHDRTEITLSAETVLSQLSAIATRLRRYRIIAKGGAVESVSSDQPEIQSFVDRAQPAPEDDEQVEFLQFYQSQFMDCLDQAIAEVIPNVITKLQQKRNATDQAFLTALHLFHCQGQSMGEIAPQICLKKQYEVTRLLKLNDLRTDIRQRSLAILRDRVMDRAKFYADVDRLHRLETQVELILNEQLSGVIEAAEAETKSPVRNQPLKSLFARRLCLYLASRNSHS
jgi:hypothetical protein